MVANLAISRIFAVAVGILVVYSIEPKVATGANIAKPYSRTGVSAMKKLLFCCFLLLSLALPALADDFKSQRANNWHQWRGPHATGFAPHGNPPTEWSETKNIKWKVAIPGRGSASPIVWGDKIFILTAIKTDRTTEVGDAEEAASTTPSPKARLVSRQNDSTLLAQNEERSGRRGRGGGERGPRPERGGFGPGGGFGRGFRGEKPTNLHQFVVLCLDRKSGKTLWSHTAAEVVPHEGHHQTGSFASASPITDGEYLYASFGSRGIYCYDLDGNQKWGKDIGDLQMRMAFGEGSSPAMYNDTLVITCDQEKDSFIVALDAKTGDEKWRKPREEVSTWATPLIVPVGDQVQVITSGSNRVRSYDLKNGDLIWECGGLGSNPIACPVVSDGLAIAMSGHHNPAGIAVFLTARGDVTGTDKVAWQIEEKTPYVSTPLLYESALYFVKSRNAVMSSIDAKTGKPIINQKRLPDMESVYASPVGAAGHVYFCSREGTTDVLKHGPEMDVIATNFLDEPIDASPAIVGNEIIIRGENHLYCIGE